ncbi:MAG: hypothetical protein GF308_05840 [Candidatus Heimdallarchaeota archaeon]|nr:hypothetical protein [Candidatus Heimdallarchaeota archaeon]
MITTVTLVIVLLFSLDLTVGLAAVGSSKTMVERLQAGYFVAVFLLVVGIYYSC